MPVGGPSGMWIALCCCASDENGAKNHAKGNGMSSVLRKFAAAAVLAVTMTTGSVLAAAPAQALPAAVTSCGPSVKAGATGLHLQTCVTRDGITVTGRTKVTNVGPAAHYVAEMQIKINWGAGAYSVCPVNSWIQPGTSGSCNDPVVSLTNQSSYYIGWARYWNGAAYVWVNANSPSI